MRIMAHALNHLAIWKTIANSTDELHLVLEDQAIFAQDWVKKWNDEYFPDLPTDTFDVDNLFFFFEAQVLA